MSTRNDIMDSLVTAFEGITIDNGYDIEVRCVSKYPRNILTVRDNDVPLVVLYDQGEEQVLEDSSYYRYRLSIEVHLVVVTSTEETLDNDALELIGAVRKLADSSQSLGDNALRFRVGDATTVAYDTEHGRAWCVLDAEILYVRQKGVA